MIRTFVCLTAMSVATGAMAESDLEARLSALEDVAALEELVHCYGAANDILYVGRYRDGAETAMANGVAKLNECFAPDTVFTATFFANLDEPFGVMTGVEQWAAGIIAFAADYNITSTRHATGGIELEIDGDTAQIHASSVTPHFQALTTENAVPSNLLIIGDYRGTAEKIDGEWIITEWFVDVVENQQVSGVYPFGYHPGDS